MEGAFCLIEDLLGGSSDHNSACLSTCTPWEQGKRLTLMNKIAMINMVQAHATAGLHQLQTLYLAAYEDLRG